MACAPSVMRHVTKDAEPRLQPSTLQQEKESHERADVGEGEAKQHEKV